VNVQHLLLISPRFRRARRELSRLADRERWSRPEIETFQCRRLNALWSHAVRFVPHYRRLSRSLDLPDRFESLDEFRNRVPILRRASIGSDTRALLSERAGPGFWHRTSGSTGAPLNVFWSRSAHREMLRSKYRFEAAWGLDMLDRKVFVWGYDTRRVRRLQLAILDRLRGRRRYTVQKLAPEDLRRYLAEIEKFRPASIYGYTNAIHLLAQEALAAGFHCSSLRCIIVTSERVTFRVRQAIHDAFQVPVVGEYGSVECGFLAGEFPDGTMRVREDVVLMEAIAGGHGHLDIVVTRLNNPSFPLIRYAIGDLTDEPLTFPERGFAILGDISGRENDLIFTRLGIPVHPARIETLFEDPGCVGIAHYRVHQETDGAVTVRVEPDGSSSPPDLAVIRQKLEELIEGYPVTLDVVDSLAGSGDKLRFVTSDLGHQRIHDLETGSLTASPDHTGHRR
jgi:phenylacetate-CoA ligase